MRATIVFVVGMSLAVGLLLASGAKTATPAADCKMNDCKAPDKWFQDNRTPPVGKDDFPDVNADECLFYKFAWQSFLYWTQSENKGDPPRFILLKTNNELFDVKGNSNEKLMITAAPKRDMKSKRVLSLSVRNSPHTSRHIQAKAVAQAGSQGVVVDQNNRCLYYGQHIDPTFVRFITTADDFGDNIKGLNVKKAEDLAGVGKDNRFPTGCVEFKSAWRALTDEEKQDDNLKKLRKKYFITDADVPTLETDAQGNIIAKPDKPKPETVALVALHVVGTTPGHPEFVWASFEHEDNSPTPPKANLGASEPVNTDREFTFYKKNTLAKDCNVNPVPDEVTTPPVKLHFKEQSKQTLEPVVPIYRVFNSGGDGVEEDEDVCPLNASVRDRLSKIDELSVWSHYKLIGAVWLKNPGTDFVAGKRFPNPSEGAPETHIYQGEERLSNSTMETFTQKIQLNCFRCHDTSQENVDGKNIPGIDIKVSHIIRNAILEAQP